jgi:hypothetical protein
MIKNQGSNNVNQKKNKKGAKKEKPESMVFKYNVLKKTERIIK